VNGLDIDAVARGAKASADEAAQIWAEPDLSLLASDRGCVPALPLDLFSPKWGKWIESTAEGAGAPVDSVALALLCAVGGSTGCGVSVEATPSWHEPLIFWGAIVGRPSTGKPILDL
jgi:hypothetical protein